MYRTTICVLFFMQSLSAIDHWEQLTPEQINQHNATLIRGIQHSIIQGAELKPVNPKQIATLTLQQLNELKNHLALYRKAILFVREHQGDTTFWRYLVSMRAELVVEPGQQYEQENCASKYERRRADIDSLNQLLQQELSRRGTIPHDPDATHLLDPDSMYYVQRRLINASDNAEDSEGNPSLYALIRNLVATGASLSLIGPHDLQDLSLQELDTIKNQLALYKGAHHTVRNVCGNGVFWRSAWGFNHVLPDNDASTACIRKRLQQCNSLSSLITEQIAQRATHTAISSELMR